MSDVDLKVTTNGKLAMASIIPKEGKKKTPCDIVCVVDVSGSMGAAALLKNAAGAEENTGLNVLDVVKHAVKTIIAALDKEDRIAIVSFNDVGMVNLELTEMDSAGHKSANEKVENLRHGGSTNIWDGCLKGLEVLRQKPGVGRNRAVLLLTDGEPVVIPEGGHLAALNRYKDTHDGLPGNVHTFGFGYNLDTSLLLELSVGGNGAFSFIPDSSFTGTVFVHALACLQTTVASHLTLSFEPEAPTKIAKFLGGHPALETSWGSQLKFGSLLCGQSKDIIVELSEEKFSELTVTLKYKDIVTGEEKTKSVTVKPSTTQDADAKAIERNRLRLMATEAIKASMVLAEGGKNKEAVDAVKDVGTAIKASSVRNETPIKDLLKDVDGQMSEAVSRADWYKKWGRHYLPSLLGAHLSQQCNNFKDPGVQHYVSKLFKSLRDDLDAIFLKLPAPKPSAPPAPAQSYGSRSSSSPNSSASVSRAPVNMSSYYSSGNPCFAGSSLVSMADGSKKKVSEIFKGDVVISSGSNSATVSCVVKTIMNNKRAQLVKLDSGLLVTPYHPVRVNGVWTFPCDISAPIDTECDAVYSFVVDGSEPVMTINDVECVSLGHGLTSSKVVEHPYFGSNKIIDDLKAMNGWNRGKVVLREGCVVRDTVTGIVVGLRQESS